MIIYFATIAYMKSRNISNLIVGFRFIDFLQDLPESVLVVVSFYQTDLGLVIVLLEYDLFLSPVT